MVYNAQTLADPAKIHEHLWIKDRRIDVEFADGVLTGLNTRKVVLNAIFWRTAFMFNVPIVRTDYVEFEHVHAGVPVSIYNKIYRRILDDYPEIPYHACLLNIMASIDTFDNLVYTDLGAYAESMDGINMLEMMNQPEIQEIISVPIKSSGGTHESEKIFKRQHDKLLVVLTDKDALKCHPMYTFMGARIVKHNQIYQELGAYGPRSDIDGAMFECAIQSSAMGGIRDYRDLGTESQSAKLSAHLNQDVIRSTQYAARMFRLSGSPVSKRYLGHCGNTTLVPITIPTRHVRNFYDKVVFLDGERIEITEDTAHKVAGKRVGMISPLTCRHHDGICEYCTGRISKQPWAWLPDVHIGIFSAAKVGASISQKVLSNKHLVYTKSVVYMPTADMQSLVDIYNNTLLIKPSNKLNGVRLRIHKDTMGQLVDLEHGEVLAEQFSNVPYFELLTPDDKVVPIIASSGTVDPYLSGHTLEWIARNIALIETTDDGFYHIPMEGFNIKKPFMKYTVKNDDMVAYTVRVNNALLQSIGGYTSLTNGLQAISTLIYDKSDVNIMFIETMLKGFLDQRDSKGVWHPITNVDDVLFVNMRDAIERASVSGKLGFERISTKEYFGKPGTFITPKGTGTYDPFILGT